VHQIHPDASLVFMLRKIVFGAVTYRLYSNDYSPDQTTVLGDLTEVANPGGYVPIVVAAADYTLGSVVTHRGSIIAAMIDFIKSNNVPQTVFGYFVTHNDDGTLLCAARFDDAPVVMDNIGDSVQVLPIFGDVSKFAS